MLLRLCDRVAHFSKRQTYMNVEYLESFKKKILEVTQKASKKKCIHFLHIGKTGGTAVVHALNQRHLCVQSRWVRWNAPDLYRLNRPSENKLLTVYVHPHNESLRDVPDGEKVFFFLRDPISRFISGFYSRQRQGQPRYNSPWSRHEKIAYQRFRTINQLALALSSTDATEKAMAEKAMQSIQHVRDSYWKWFRGEEYFMSRLADIFFVGFQENLAQDFGILKSKLNLPNDVELPTDDVLAHKNPLDVDKTLDDKAMANLKQWYKDEYRFISLCKEVLSVDIFSNPMARDADAPLQGSPR
jgi:hypothetical protein